MARLAGGFPRRETRTTFRDITEGLLRELEEVNCRILAEAVVPELDLPCQPPLEVLVQARRHPSAAVVLVVPDEDIRPVDQGKECEQVSVPRVREEEQWIERHVQGGEAGVLAKSLVLGDDALGGPDEPGSVFAHDAVALAEQRGEVGGQWMTEDRDAAE
jgi:hypothetical protein